MPNNGQKVQKCSTSPLCPLKLHACGSYAQCQYQLQHTFRLHSSQVRFDKTKYTRSTNISSTWGSDGPSTVTAEPHGSSRTWRGVSGTVGSAIGNFCAVVHRMLPSAHQMKKHTTPGQQDTQLQPLNAIRPIGVPRIMTLQVTSLRSASGVLRNAARKAVESPSTYIDTEHRPTNIFSNSSPSVYTL
jgi:hypothetical protein